MATYCTPEDVRDALRLTGAVNFDEARIVRATEVATAAIDNFLDRPADQPLDDPPPAPVTQAAVNLGVEEYRRPGAAFGALGYAGADALVTVTQDHLVGVRTLLLPYKRQWGVA